MKILGIGLDSSLEARLREVAPESSFAETAATVRGAEHDVAIACGDDPAAFFSRVERERLHGAPYVLWAARGEALARALALGADDGLSPDGSDLVERLLVAKDRIARRRTREPLLMLLEQLEALGEAPLAYLEVAPNGAIRHASTSLAHLAGYESTADLVGRSVLELYADPTERDALLAELEQRGTTMSHPARLRNRSGEMRHMLLSTVLHDGGVHGLAVDVTEAHRVLDQLRQNEELTRRILEAMPGGVVHVRSGGAVLRANAEAQRILGLRQDELNQRFVADFEQETIREDGTPCAADEYPVSLALSTGEPQPPTTIGVRRPDGTLSWAVFTAVPVKDPISGETTGAVVTFVDITEHRAALAALAESEERYKKLVEHSPDPMAIVSADRLLFVNAAGVELVGMSRERMTGASAMGLVPPEFEPEVTAYVESALAGKRVGTVQVDLVHSSGERVAVELSAAPLVYEGHAATLVVARDIRARRRAEEELGRLQARFQHTQKLESLGVLAGGIAHDFNNLLSAVLGNASLAKLHLPEDSSATKYVAAIEKAAQQAADLTGQMLAYSGHGRVTAEPVNLPSLVNEMLELLGSVVSKKATLETRFDEDLPAVLGDISQLRQVVMNLILNASDALDDRPGRISLTSGVCKLEREELANSYLDDGLPPGSYVYLNVSDTGRGMDPATLAKVFDPFFTTKATGRGLGLAATLGIIRAHRGAVTVRSTPGEGTQFHVYLPAAAGASSRPAPPDPARPTVGDATVLVVDDEPMVREVTGAMLEELGYECRLAESGASALRELEAAANEIDVVVLDLTMPDMSGTEALALMRALRPELPVVLCSGYSELDVTDRAGVEDASAFLQKPFTTSELVAKLREALGR